MPSGDRTTWNVYQPTAPPVLGRIVPRRPCYVTERQLLDVVASGEWASVWRLGASVTTVETKSHAMVRPWEAWGSVRDLETAAAWWTARGLRAPSSPAALVVKAAPEWYRAAAWSRHGTLLTHLAGGWQEAQVRGIILGPHKLYDMRKAYRWALTAGSFPERHSIQVARAWTPTAPGLHLLAVEPWPGAPWPLRDGGVVLVETPEDVDRYGLPRVREWLGGVTWSRTMDAHELAEIIDGTGVAACARTYWGPWVAQTPVSRTYSTGTVTQLRPRGTDAVRGHLILARVRRRVAELAASYVYVDSGMVPASQAVAVGERIGDWREVRDYPDGVWIGWPGAYGPARGRPDRMAGQRRAVEEIFNV